MSRPLFHKQHYESVARILSIRKPKTHTGDRMFGFWQQIVEEFCIVFWADNERFDRNKFILSCTKERKVSE